MPDGLGVALATPGLVWVLAACVLAGVVYGFAGFGAGLVFMPVAVIWLDPPLAVAAFSVVAIISLFTIVPRAWAEADRPAALTLVAAALAGMPIGLQVLTADHGELVRWIILAVTAGTLLALVAGWRRTTRGTLTARVGVGFSTGIVGAATGLLGPIMVLFQLSSPDGAGRSRANAILFLTFGTMLLLPVMWMSGALPSTALWLGALLLAPYGAGTLVGQALFDPARDGLYRMVAYVVIAAAIVAGLPVWS
ncbi:sulfite exporter TauE/SafE family protein [Actibacterium sp. 188UL27-1]|uniref:sulfite exporter TauE/SafE family protein n=1 Tax=Actibacterium sp. 188UL27-1 TaxID=2786961 RepID=UPI001956A273|nr:sulfite exporter TauE/SafE family protein [Actibacterium sp. 188UL27-1]MBM7066691.1 sulfite exporter TauE/SafE family protein [Actibacterium sp. 188UL27-1]